jgi:hypothetical protein
VRRAVEINASCARLGECEFALSSYFGFVVVTCNLQVSIKAILA